MTRTRRWNRYLRGLAAVLALSLVAACSDDEDGDGATGPDTSEGTFTATVSGDVDASIQGEAAWGGATDPETGDQAWVVALGDESQNAVLVVHIGDDQPNEQSYSLADITGTQDFEAGTAALIVVTIDSSTLSVGSTGGSITVTSSSSDRVQGTFSITASGVLLENGMSTEVDVTISGEFDAVGDSNVGFPGI